jgi:hypothetical protein
MRIVARTGIVLFGAIAIVWAVLVFPVFLQQQKPVAMASALERGEGYDLTNMLAQSGAAPQVDYLGFCNAATLRANMIILTKVLADPSVVENRTLKEAGWQKLHSATRALLACSPSDSLGWLILFWLNVSKNGYTTEYGNYLQLSYETSPNEAAVALWRNRLVLGLYDRLPSQFTDRAIPEFVKLVNSERLYAEMGDVFERAAPALRQRLALAMKTADPRPREVFERMLNDRGVRAVIPDTQSILDRPWN